MTSSGMVDGRSWDAETELIATTLTINRSPNRSSRPTRMRCKPRAAMTVAVTRTTATRAAQTLATTLTMPATMGMTGTNSSARPPSLIKSVPMKRDGRARTTRTRTFRRRRRRTGNRTTSLRRRRRLSIDLFIIWRIYLYFVVCNLDFPNAAFWRRRRVKLPSAQLGHSIGTLRHHDMVAIVPDLESLVTPFGSATRTKRGFCPVTKIRHQGSGPEKLVFVMGLNSSSFSWLSQVQHFGSLSDYTVLVFDNRGVGHSGTPRGPYSTSGMAEDIIVLLDYLSWTGKRDIHVVELATRIPDRIASLVLAVTTPGGYFWNNFSPWKGTRSLAKLTFTADVEDKIPIILDMVYPAGWLDEPVEGGEPGQTNREEQILVYRRRIELTPKQHLTGVFSQMAAALTHHVSPERLRFICDSIPKVLILTGDRDNLVNPAHSRRIKAAMPDAEFVEWVETGHAIHALNTVLAFVSSRKHLASSFDSIRASVENLLKRQGHLELQSVAELKALLPDLVKFAYIPHNEVVVNDASNPDSRRAGNEDFRLPSTSTQENDSDHILILEFLDKSNGRKAETSQDVFTAPATLTPSAMKKLVERRNSKYESAVNELLSVAAATDSDAVEMLKSAAREHIPVDPKQAKTSLEPVEIPEPSQRASIDSILSRIVEEEWYRAQISHRRTVDARSSVTGTLDAPLSEAIQTALQRLGNISTLYSHQAAAINAVHSRKNVIVSTSTASGKSVIYQVPVLQFLEADPTAKAVFVYPTKALAQDQRGSFEQLISHCAGLEHVKVATYDGDTPQELRAVIRGTASVIFTNFDMIHASILPHEEVWRNFLKHLKIFVVDELHYYSGVFGSHVAQILRRLRRVLHAVGNRRTVFVSCSATISNPGLHMQKLFGLDESSVEAVTEDGAPSGVKDYVIWQPPQVDNRPTSGISEATALMVYLMQRGVRTILFCKIRKVCEIAMKNVRLQLSKEGRFDILDRVQSYRGGASSDRDRRRIEQDAFSGRLLGIVATNALELGVDIGVLDAVVMLGFPVSLASFRQQAGRAGRRARDSLALFVAEHLPVDQYFAKNPDELFDGVIADQVIDLDNQILLEAHLQCAAQEMPICDADSVFFGPLMKSICESKLRKDAEGWYHTHPNLLPSPGRNISIRGIQTQDLYAVIDMTFGVPVMLEELELLRAMFEVIARVTRADVNWVTAPRDFTDVDAIQTWRIKQVGAWRACYGRVHVQVIVFGFYKIRHNTILDAVALDTAPWSHTTTGFWIDLPAATLALLRLKRFLPAAAIHSAAHAVLNGFVFADVKTECKAAEKELLKKDSKRKRPARLIFYDSVGLEGVSRNAFDHGLLRQSARSQVVPATKAAPNACVSFPCVRITIDRAAGVYSPACKEKNSVASKLGALIVLRGILGIFIDAAAIPEQDSDADDSIVPASGVGAITDVLVETYNTDR
ncbi:unnamed protein product [Mycena citricolor]|uniref:P-loop containing nucleoside triphosphate hydrolase protein n=1 Tax=Mycena citricolor TaxID=2018698 RepID=A0AAD2GWJ3_9AGAR|nr:unnamed protein product [Mycena citricolor]